MTQHHKTEHPVDTAVGQAVSNLEQAHADDLAGKSHTDGEGSAAAGSKTPDDPSKTTKVDVEKDGVHVQTGQIADTETSDKD